MSKSCFAGFTDFAFSQACPAPLGRRERLRVLALRLVRWLAGSGRCVATGDRQAIGTETVFCRCRKGT